MARPRTFSNAEAHKEPHSVSLKVLRLSRPSLSHQHPLPNDQGAFSQKASLSYPSDSSDPQFILSPNVVLPPAFGSAYVGETFSCSLSGNVETPAGDSRVVGSLRIIAEMQTPSQTIPLDLFPLEDNPEQPISLSGVSNVQKIIRFDLKDEGNHVLSVSVNYTETLMVPNPDIEGEYQASGGRVRSFRKLYQFVAQPCLNVRTKATELEPLEVDNRALGPYGKSQLYRFALEAQLENVGDEVIVLGVPQLNSRSPFKARSLNWDSGSLMATNTESSAPTLAPRDIRQIAFLVEQEPGQQEGIEAMQKDMSRDGRISLGQLSIDWQSAMGERGYLTTGNLMTKKRP
ncbi:hypothetical protein FQN57_000330 [Myotisia sp. PD_48]|nr:hypothetical protein FQN57_000330 [Myotisia sp. PD_48]